MKSCFFFQASHIQVKMKDTSCHQKTENKFLPPHNQSNTFSINIIFNLQKLSAKAQIGQYTRGEAPMQQLRRKHWQHKPEHSTTYYVVVSPNVFDAHFLTFHVIVQSVVLISTMYNLRVYIFFSGDFAVRSAKALPFLPMLYMYTLSRCMRQYRFSPYS